VETRGQLLILKDLRLVRAGLYLARPVPADEITSALDDGHRWDLD